MARRTEIYPLEAAPVRINTPERELGDAGAPLGLANIGDDPAFWLIAAAAPTGQPGFKIERASEHLITLPDALLWAWSPARSRLLVTPLEPRQGIIPLATAAFTVGQTPVRVSTPAGIEEGADVLIYHAGGRPVSHVWANTETTPQTAASRPPLQTGESFTATFHAAGVVQDLWLWCDRFAGATILVTPADGGWSV